MTEHPNLALQLDSQPSSDKSKSDRLLQAIREGAREAIAVHGAAGRLIPVSKDGKVVYVSSDDLLKQSSS